MTVSPSQPNEQSGPDIKAHGGAPTTIFSAYRRTQALVLIGSLICAVLFWEVAARLSVPPVARFQGSLLRQSQPVLALAATYILYFAAVMIGIIIAGRSWFFAGIFTGAVGLAALSVRCGAMHFVLFDAAANGDTKRIFLQLMAEQCLLFVPVALAWNFFWRRYAAAQPEPEPGAKDLAPDSPASTIGAVVTQIAVMGLLVWLLSPTDAKKQVSIAVFIGAFAGSSLGEYLSPNRKAAGWYWIGPFVVGAVGYLMAYINATDWTIGSAQGSLAALARPVPLDYSGAGMIGALLGYWVGGDRPDIVFSVLGGMVGIVPASHRLSKQISDQDKPRPTPQSADQKQTLPPEAGQ